MSTISHAWRLAFAEPDTRPIPDWARDGNVICHPPLTKHGPLDCSESRHFLAPLDALQDDYVQEVNARGPVRGGKTLIGDAWLCHCVKRDPGPFRASFQDDQIAKEHAETRTWPFLESLPGFAEMLPADRHKRRTQEILLPHMPIYVQGPALGKMQSKGFRYMWLDEVWLYKGGRIDEAKGRLGDYQKLGIAKLFCTSQGGNQDDEWDQQFATGEHNEWAIACPKCGRYQLPDWHAERPDNGTHWGIVWDEVIGKDNFWDVDACVATVRYECAYADCRHIVTDSPRLKSEWNRVGRYEVQGKTIRERKSYHWNAIIDFPWTLLLRMYLDARNEARAGSSGKLVIWVQKRMALSFDPARWTAHERLPRVQLSLSWAGEKYRFMTVDVQESHFWAVVRSWGDAEARLLWAGRLQSWADVEAKQKEFKVVNACVFVDCSYKPRDVYLQCALHTERKRLPGGKVEWVGWKSLNGEESERKSFRWKNAKGEVVLLPYSYPASIVDPGLGTADAGKRFCKMHLWSNAYIKDILLAYRDGTAEGFRWLAFDGVDPEWQQHMFGERKIIVADRYGQQSVKWERIGKRRCDLWDCEAMQLVANEMGKHGTSRMRAVREGGR